MTGSVTTQLTEQLQLLHRQVISEQMEQDILQTTRMSITTITLRQKRVNTTGQIGPGTANWDFWG
jgi:hypothetical protein